MLILVTSAQEGINKSRVYINQNSTTYSCTIEFGASKVLNPRQMRCLWTLQRLLVYWVAHWTPMIRSLFGVFTRSFERSWWCRIPNCVEVEKTSFAMCCIILPCLYLHPTGYCLFDGRLGILSIFLLVYRDLGCLCWNGSSVNMAKNNQKCWVRTLS